MGGTVMALAAGFAAVTDDWLRLGLIVLAVVGLYGAVAPLLRWWPWRERLNLVFEALPASRGIVHNNHEYAGSEVWVLRCRVRNDGPTGVFTATAVPGSIGETYPSEGTRLWEAQSIPRGMDAVLNIASVVPDHRVFSYASEFGSTGDDELIYEGQATAGLVDFGDQNRDAPPLRVRFTISGTDPVALTVDPA